MPKNLEASEKIRVPLTSDHHVISLKSKTQPLTNYEMVTLNNIYNEAILRLERTVELMDNLEEYLSLKDDKSSIKNIKQLLIDENADPTLLHTLKMIKRHFYISITDITINELIFFMSLLKIAILKTWKGLEGHLALDLMLHISDGEPNDSIIQSFKDKTYVLMRNVNNTGWKFVYYENKVKKNEVALDEKFSSDKMMMAFLPGINSASLDEIKRESQFLMHHLTLYHATKQEVHDKNKAYISHISRKRQNNAKNTDLGYVNRDDNGTHYGAIHLDYRLLKKNPYLAMSTLIHEASHRYAEMKDNGYYHGTKKIKNNKKNRRYPVALPKEWNSTMLASENAASYEYFVCDMTGEGRLYTKKNSPAWCHQERYKKISLPESYGSTNQLLKLSIFAATLIVTGGVYYVTQSKPTAPHAGKAA